MSPNTTKTKCSQCGAASQGKFCSNCGAPLAASSCPACGTTLSGGARFCHMCGAPLGKKRDSQIPIPWIVAVLAISVAVVAVVARPGQSQREAPPSGQASSQARPAPDISSMTPRQQADRLFERIAMAAQQGDTQQIAFFVPMALSAYGRLAQLDNDARYHLGYILLAAGDGGGALAQADSIALSAPEHLFSSILRQSVADAANDNASALNAYSEFLANYDREMAAGRPEYTEHGPLIEAFRTEANQAVGGGSD